MLFLKSLMYSSIITASLAAALTAYAFLAIKSPIDYSILIINFIGTFVGYNLISLITLLSQKHLSKNHHSKETQTDFMQWFIIHKYKIIYSLFIVIPVILFYAISLKKILLFNFVHLFIIILIYERGLFQRFKLFFNFREITYLKPLVISYTWTMACVCSPMLEYGFINWNLLISTFLSIYALCLMYDLRDIDTDNTEGLVTIAHKLKINHFKFLIWSFYIASLLFRNTFIPITEKTSLYFFEVLLVSLLIYKARPNQDDYLYILVSDGLMAFKLLYVLG